MYMLDFFYDNASLKEDFNSIIGSISSNSDETALGSERNLNTVKIGEEEYITEAKYSDSYSTSFDIISNPCEGEFGYSYEDIYRINMWLNQRKYKKFKPIYSDDSFPDLYFMATFTSVTATKVGDKVIGFHLEMQTNAPYGFADVKYKKTLTSQDNALRIYNDSQEEGYLYPSIFKVKCRESGNLIIRNNQDNNNLRTTRIDNVSSGEIITFNGEYETMTSSRDREDLWTSFNYNFPRLVRKPYEETLNVFTLDSSGIQSADVEVEYAAVRRTGIIL